MAMFISCDQPFDSKGSFDKRLVVYSVLSTDRDVQFVRVEKDYMPEGYDPLADSSDHFLTNAEVQLQSAGLTNILRDSTIARTDTSRYKFPLRTYFVKPLKITHGESYTVIVRSPQYEQVSASIVVPQKPVLVMTPVSNSIIENPGNFSDSSEILITMFLGSGSIGYLGRLFLDYSVQIGGEWVDKRTEVPVAYAYSGLKDFRFIRYAQLTRNGYNNVSASVYRNDLYLKTLSAIAFDKYPKMNIIFHRVVFQVMQVERNLYAYYRVAHAYNDPHSTRLDEPLYSNVAGGVGVIGAYTVDSLVNVLPENFVENRR
jgi:hypothetical protein